MLALPTPDSLVAAVEEERRRVHRSCKGLAGETAPLATT
jgi:hypothetical protein